MGSLPVIDRFGESLFDAEIAFGGRREGGVAGEPNLLELPRAAVQSLE